MKGFLGVVTVEAGFDGFVWASPVASSVEGIESKVFSKLLL